MGEEKKCCGNCQWEVCDGLCNECRCSHPETPVVCMAPYKAGKYYCNQWAPRQLFEPTEYRPDDGPFYAIRLDTVKTRRGSYYWAVNLGYDADGDPIYDGDALSFESAKKLVDALNRASKEWAQEYISKVLKAAGVTTFKDVNGVIMLSWPEK